MSTGYDRYERPSERRPRPTGSRKKSSGNGERQLPWETNRILLICFGLCLVWGLFNLHPYASSGAETTDETSSVTVETEEEAADETTASEDGEAEEETAAARTHYTISHDAVAGQTPDASCYGSVPVENAEKMEDVIQQARDLGLLGEDEKIAFNPKADFNTGSYAEDIKYYLDESIFVICWKEIIDGNTCTFSEIKIADGSQIRRKLTGDSYGTQATEFLSELVSETNAVVAFNADFYAFRDMGIMGYQDKLYQYSDSKYTGSLKMYNCLDNLFITHDGDFVFTHRGDEYTEEELQQFMTDNDVCFTVSFGPILVENGELCDEYVDTGYAIGDVNDLYSRAGIGQMGELHYLYMSLNHSDEKEARWTTYTFAEHFADKGVINAYALDGGQTSEVYFDGAPYNHIDWGTERAVSDMIYFATAVPSN